MKPLRVLYLEAGSGSGGSSASLVRLLTHLDRDRVEPYVLVHQRGTFIEQLRALKVPVEQVPVRGGGDGTLSDWRRAPSRLWQNLLAVHWPLFRETSHYIRRWRPDTVHLNNSPRVALGAVIAAMRHGLPVICHLRTARSLDRIERLAVRWMVDVLIVISETSRGECIAQGMPSEKVAFVPNGIDVAGFRNGYDEATARRQLGFQSEDAVIGNVGRLIPGKGQDVFLRAMRLVVDRQPNARTAIVGDLREGTSDYPDRLKRLVEELNLTAHVRFTGWTSNPAQIYPAFDVLAQTSLLPEGLPGVCLEAMASRLPVVSTAVGGALDIVEDGVTGRLVMPGDPQGMADALLALLSDRQQMRQMGEAGYRRALERFDIRTAAAAIEAVYRSLARQVHDVP